MAALITWLTLLPAAPPEAYPRPDLLIEPAALVTPEQRARFRVLDCRGRGNYRDGHVPGAVWVDVVSWGRAFNQQPADADAWSNRFGELGIDPARAVVVYASDLREAARAWWILRYWGVADARLLNGGWAAWQAAGGPVEPGEVRPPATAPRLSAHADRLATKGQVLDALKAPDRPQLLDARSAEEFCGRADTARRNGAIPGAVRLEWSELLDPQTRRFKPPRELAKLLAERGVDPDKPAVTYCQSGGRAAALAFGLELMGGKQVRNYYRSWSEWGNADDTPVAKPPNE
jgi:thiosulfate/3-mercaptopyruvate sulfurtransferase